MRSKNKVKTGFLHLYFQVHQPRRLGQFGFFDIGTDRDYFDDGLNQIIMRRVADNCYLPTNILLLQLIKKYPRIRITFSISGSALKQMEVFAPDALESFQRLAATGAVEFLSETYYHSLSSLFSRQEFRDQIVKHVNKVKQLFGITPTVFRNTELIYNDEIGNWVSDLGFKGIVTDGVERILGGHSPNHLYQHPERTARIFLRNYRLSDDIAFRFSQKDWIAWPLSPEKYVTWLEAVLKNDEIITLGMDYETFGEHQKSDTGIMVFLESLLVKLAKHKHIKFISPSQAIELIQPVGQLKITERISWADEHKDLTAWLGNDIQQDAFENLGKLEAAIKNTGNPILINAWRYLQTSDHYYYMSTKSGNDGGVHHYFSPYASLYEAFMNYMNILSDFLLKLEKKDYCEEKWPIDEIYAKLNGMESHWKPESLTF